SLSQLRSGNNTFETTKFTNPTGLLTVNRGNAADTLTVNALPDYTNSLTVGSVGSEFSTATIAAALNLSGGALSVTANSILLNGGTVTTSGNQTYTGPVTLGAHTTLNAGSGNVGFSSTVTGAFNLAVNSTGTTTLGGAVSIAALSTNAGGS